MKARQDFPQLDLAKHTLADMQRLVVADVRRFLNHANKTPTCILTEANIATESDCSTHAHEEVDAEQCLVETLNEAVPRVATRAEQMAVVAFFVRTPALLRYIPVFREDDRREAPIALANYARAVLYDRLYESARKSLDC
jgi:hypothetical protein